MNRAHYLFTYSRLISYCWCFWGTWSYLANKWAPWLGIWAGLPYHFTSQSILTSSHPCWPLLTLSVSCVSWEAKNEAHTDRSVLSAEETPLSSRNSGQKWRGRGKLRTCISQMLPLPEPHLNLGEESTFVSSAISLVLKTFDEEEDIPC